MLIIKDFGYICICLPEGLGTLSLAHLRLLVAELLQLVLGHTLLPGEHKRHTQARAQHPNLPATAKKGQSLLSTQRRNAAQHHHPATHSDGALKLLDAAGALLGGLLGNTLLVLAAVEDRPGNLAGVLLLVEERLGLGGDEEVRATCIHAM
jgi:hypothetical protein